MFQRLQKTLMAAVIGTLLAPTLSSARSSEVPYEASVGAEVMIRQVLMKKLLKGPHAASQTRVLKSALTGAVVLGIKARLSGMSCDRALGSDFCDLTIYSVIKTGGEVSESAEVLRVRVHLGEVNFAEMHVIAG